MRFAIFLCPFCPFCVYLYVGLFCFSCTSMLDTDNYNIHKTMIIFVDRGTLSTGFFCVFEKVTIARSLWKKWTRCRRSQHMQSSDCGVPGLCIDPVPFELQYNVSPVVLLRILEKAQTGKILVKRYTDDGHFFIAKAHF